MIIVLNCGMNETDNSKHDYQVKIGREILGKFTHTRTESLAKCLKLAADAVEKKS